MSAERAATEGKPWGISRTHPYLVELQRLWVAQRAVGLGYNVLVLSNDAYVRVNPLRFVREPMFSRFGVLTHCENGFAAGCGYGLPNIIPAGPSHNYGWQ